MNTFSPANDLEASLVAAKAKKIPLELFLQKLLESQLALPSASEVLDDGTGFAPILYEKHGVMMLAAFTDKSRVSQMTDLAPYCLVMTGENVVRRIPPQYGLVINPGLEVGLDFSPDGLRRILHELR